MSNRIGGDFNADAVEAFRAAYAAQLMTPEDLDMHKESGLPGNTISNTSPWIEKTGLWRYPSGKGPDDDLQKPFNVQEYLPEEDEEFEDDEYYSDDDEEGETQAYDDDEYEDEEFSDEDLDAFVDQLLADFDDEFLLDGDEEE